MLNRRDLLKGGAVAVTAVTTPLIRVTLADTKNIPKESNFVRIGIFAEHNQSQNSYQTLDHQILLSDEKLIVSCVNGELKVDLVREK